MRRWNLFLAFLLPLFVTGNAIAAGNWFEDKMSCIVTGAVAGAAVGAVADGITVGGGTVGGAIIGALFCQAADSDGDGVPDYRDKCPGTPKGAKVDEDGCEIKAAAPAPAPAPAPAAAAPVDGDSDGDGVPDSKDKCPGTPKGTKVDHTGCPLVEKITLKGVWFAFDSAKITEESAKVLDEVALIFKRYPNLVAEMAGHTCSIGTEKYNQGLSERRANAVRAYLISKGVPANQLGAKGYGELKPVASNATREGRAQNRRTEMIILKQ
ncbi:OOP family OmpA-OmpF porin [Sulfuritortus calidifontis]|uniref:OOP family OmpA-OmpF porin n=1 Tax=Sulfuritortus calidifontis TaxID=1914471 RepID=A0A4R3JXA2_9PROT|nr:OmpA family protein [Sulfuritortus calidifontis]TCS73063.1 OOP family OmpA-OmpF porin [Sulfuritortus calidifontis]